MPLSVSKIGVYHQVIKENGEFKGLYRRSWWRFWEKGAQTFRYQSGESVNVLFNMFAPSRFKDQIFVKWSYYQGHHWSESDAVPVSISGGREQGFRGFASKKNYFPGDWRATLKTTDGREISRIDFTIEADPAPSQDFETDLY